MSNEKSSRKSSSQSSAPKAGDSPTPPSAGSLASKIVHLSVRDLKKGDKVLYPGNKVIPVDSVQEFVPYVPATGIDFNSSTVYVVKFDGQPADCYLAFEPSAMIYVYKG